MNKRIVILGAGSVGTVIGTSLAEKYPGQVTLIGRKGHVEAMNMKGCRIVGDFEKTVQVEAAEKIDFSLDDMLLIIAVKITDLENSIREILPYLTAATTVLMIQNGYGVKEIANATLNGTVPQTSVHQAIATMGAVLKAPGLLEFFGGGLKAEKSFADSEYGKIFDNTFMTYKVTYDIRKAVFIKLVINSIVNPLSVIFRAQNMVIAEERFNDLKGQLLTEGLEVAKAEGFDIRLEVSDINKFIGIPNRTSMLQDYFKKKPNEIDYINGVIIKLGEKHGIDVSTNKLIYSIVKNIETNRIEGKEEISI